MNKNRLKTVIPYIINIIIITSLLLINLKLRNIYPFGNTDFTQYDGLHQYKPILYNFITSIKLGTINSYNFLNGLGNPTIFNYLYYLASPLNLIALPFTNPDAMNFSVILTKTIITSTITFFYCQKKFKSSFISIICSISYTYSGWYLAYYYNLMWLDSFMVFPLLQYGLEELITKNKCYLYIFSLSYIMLTNFYMAFIVSIYIFIYYMYNLILKKEKYLYKIKNFQLIMFSTIITCLVSAFTIYATYQSFLSMGIYIDVVENNETTLSFLDFIKSFFTGHILVNSETSGEIIPNICTNTLMLISLIYFFCNKNISLKDKLHTLGGFLIITITLYSKQMNYIINCFHVPAGYHFRYSFIISFYIISLFMKNYQVFKHKIDYKVYLINFILFIILTILYLTHHIVFSLYIFNLVYLISYTIFFLTYNKSLYHKILLLVLIISETFISINLSLSNNISKIEQYLYEQKTNNEYRYLLDNGMLVNDNLYSSYATIESFSSMQYHNVIELLDNMGCRTDLKASIYECNQNELFKMLFNIEGIYPLPKIYAVKEDVLESNITTPDFINNLENLATSMSDTQDFLLEDKITFQEKNIFKITISEDKNYFFYTDKIKYLKVNNILYTSSLQDVPSIYQNLNLNTKLSFINNIHLELKAGDELEIVLKDGIDDSQFSLYYWDKDKLLNLYTYLKDNSLKVDKNQGDLIEGTVEVDKDEIIFTTIPYDKNWQVQVDGEIVKPISINNTLLGFRCSKGIHSIKLEYKNHLTGAIAISLMTLSIVIINYYYKNHVRNKKDIVKNE